MKIREQKEIREFYKKFSPEIKLRIKELKRNFFDKEKILKEFIFCTLTPQSKAKICWMAVEEIFRNDALNEKGKILKHLKGVRFKNNKANYIMVNVRIFPEILKKLNEEKNIFKLRDYLVKNVKGFGYKEASHFLRNIGKGKDLAILDRHILKNLKNYKVIKEIPDTITKKKYLEIEEKMREFSKKIKIPLEELDFLFWAKETGEVFK